MTPATPLSILPVVKNKHVNWSSTHNLRIDSTFSNVLLCLVEGIRYSNHSASVYSLVLSNERIDSKLSGKVLDLFIHRYRSQILHMIAMFIRIRQIICVLTAQFPIQYTASHLSSKIIFPGCFQRTVNWLCA